MATSLAQLPRADLMGRGVSRVTNGLRSFLDATPVDRRNATPWLLRIAAALIALVYLLRDPKIAQLVNLELGVTARLAETGPAQFVTFLLAAGIAVSWWMPGLGLLLVGGTLAIASLLASLVIAPMVYGDVATLPIALVLSAWPWWWHLVNPGTRHQPANRLLDARQRLWMVPALALTIVAFVYWRALFTSWGSVDKVRMDTWASLLLLVPLLAVLAPRAGFVAALAMVVGSTVLPSRLIPAGVGMGVFHAWPVMATLVLIMVGAIARHRHGWVRVAAWGVALGLHASLYLGLGATFAGTIQALEMHRTHHDISTAGGLYRSLWTSYLVHIIVLVACIFIDWHISRTVAMKERSSVLSVRETQVSERARLARDLHDVVAHHVSLIAVRAETAPYTHPTLDAQGRELVAEIAEDARRALDELRGVLGLLRRSDLEGGAAETAPLPGGNDLVGLVERNMAAGMAISLADQRGAYTELVYASSRGHVIYRVLQEALTNARRHAPEQPVLVMLSDQAPQLVVANPTAGAGSEMGAGTGIVGMTERVEALGGQLQIADDGLEFRVEVHL